MKRRYFLFSKNGGKPVVYAAVQGKLEEMLDKLLKQKVSEKGFVRKVKKIEAVELLRKNAAEMKESKDKGEDMPLVLQTKPICCDTESALASS